MPAGPESSGAGDEHYVFTLVHGTWARNALWIGPQSALSRALRQRFNARAKLFSFEWTGANSHTARREASEKLRGELEQRLENHPGANHYLICHSHGGNVALHALAGSELQDKIAGIVCLATPFLVARQRDLGRNPTKHLVGALVVVMFLTLWIVNRLLLPVSLPAWGAFAVTVVVTAVVMGAVAALVPKWRTYADKLRQDLATPALESDKLVIIRSPADEASAALALFQFISQISVRLLMRSHGLYERFEAAAHRWARQKGKMLALAAGALLAFVGLVFIAASLPWEAGFGRWLQVLVIVAIIVPLLGGMMAMYLFLGWVGSATIFFRLAAATVVWPVIILLSVLLLPFGREVAMANILLEVTAETTPPGSWMVHLIEPPTSEELGKNVPPLMHSVYENPRVLEFVCNWIAGDK